MAERGAEQTVCNWAERDGWFVRKLAWPGRKGAPDRLFAKAGRVVFIEFKDVGEGARVIQQREHRRMRAAGLEVHVCQTAAQACAVLEIRR